MVGGDLHRGAGASEHGEFTTCKWQCNGRVLNSHGLTMGAVFSEKPASAGSLNIVQRFGVCLS